VSGLRKSCGKKRDKPVNFGFLPKVARLEVNVTNDTDTFVL
jgi:hypothetical protein